ELDGISKSLKKNIANGLENKKDHQDSIFPKDYEYNSDEYKMYIDKKSHHVVFYKIVGRGDNQHISIQKCIHSTDLKKELDEKDVKPLKNADKSLLDDLNTIYKEDEIAKKDDNDDDENGNDKEEIVYDEEKGKRVKHVVHTGPRGGRYYKSESGEKVYVENCSTLKSLKSAIYESNIVPLSDIIQKHLLKA
ncbi:MAG: hypothetical protein J6X10_00340, partial [Bacteroidales bacterium]|nr:hypothetical protein [Bacteroidales bacterium]